MSKPLEQVEVKTGELSVVANGGEGGEPFEGKCPSTTSIDDKVKVIRKPLIVRKDENQGTCCCFDIFKKRDSGTDRGKECEDRKRGFLYWCVTILAL
jgi:hypothetical protein